MNILKGSRNHTVLSFRFWSTVAINIASMFQRKFIRPDVLAKAKLKLAELIKVFLKNQLFKQYSMRFSGIIIYVKYERERLSSCCITTVNLELGKKATVDAKVASGLLGPTGDFP